VIDENQMTDEVQPTESHAESSTATEAEQQTPQAEKPVNQEAVNKRFNEITAQKYEEKARADEAERKLAELQLQQQQFTPQAEIQSAPPQAQIEPPSHDLL